MSNEKRDLVLAPGTFAYMQDNTKGVIKTYTGPTVVNPTAQEIPVVYEEVRRAFRPAKNLEEALSVSPIAAEGFYITLMNPTKDNRHPDEGAAQPSPELQMGRTINIPGPTTFALWPGQIAHVVEGHHLRSNQYLLVRVYNEDEAKKNWSKAVIKSVEGSDEVSTVAKVPADLVVGKQLIIRGTEVSFYIPPTGIEVVPEPNGDYTRDALTLERLEYAILVDENGKKRFEEGPQVVFPLPSERFIEKKEGNNTLRKFRAIELNEIQGLHIKVIAPYTENNKTYNAGDEIFITGKDTAIYFPREEHSVVHYDGKSKHFATAIPVGEARYVMNRLNGEIRMVRGPAMLLPDPRHEVIIRRVLSERECNNWYPGNVQVLEYNRGLRNILANVPTTRSGAISEGDYERGAKNVSSQLFHTGSYVGYDSNGIASASGTRNGPRANEMRGVSNNSIMQTSKVSGDQNVAIEEFSRSATYTQPRTLTLDTKFQGVPNIDVWNGFAALVVSKTGKRRVEQGPTTILMEYDETLELLSLSTGKPKNTDNLLQTPFLQVKNNKVSDIVEVETVDHVKIDICVSMHVNFVGDDSAKWFQVNNYVKFLCDHVRSVLKGHIQKLSVEEFYTKSTDLVRNFILGSAENNVRPGMLFEQNNMHVTDVEVLRVTLRDDKIRQMLDHAQHEVVRTNLDMSALRRQLELSKDRELMIRDELQTKAETQLKKDQISIELSKSAAELASLSTKAQLKQAEDNLKVQRVAEDSKNEVHRAELARRQEEKNLEQLLADKQLENKLKFLDAETRAMVERFAAIQGGFTEALVSASNNDTLVQIAKAWDTSKMIAGESLADTLQRIFTGTPLKGLVDKMNKETKNGERARN